MNQKDYFNKIKSLFDELIVANKQVLNAYCYNNHDASDIIKDFISEVKKIGLLFSTCHHANGIGNNNEYVIYINGKDNDGFVVKKEVAKFYYCYGIFGGVYASLTDVASNMVYRVGKAS